MIKAPNGCIEYVIIHELCHLIHHDHTQKFIDLQTREMKDWEKWKMKLEKLLAWEAYTQKHTHLQAAQAQAQTKACKRVCFSATQKEIQFFLPSLRCFIFSPPTADTKTVGQKQRKPILDKAFQWRSTEGQLVTRGIVNCRFSGYSSGTACIKSSCNLIGKCYEIGN